MLFKYTLITFLLLNLVGNASNIEWLSPTTHDFGDLIRDEPVVHEFKYRNLTDAPLVIDNVRTSCGCTTSEWQESPVAPDSIGMLRVEYDARNSGFFRKYVKVYFHGQRKAHKLWLEGFVEQLN